MTLLKNTCFEILRFPGINRVLRLCRPILTRLDHRIADRFPVRGRFGLKFGKQTAFHMRSDGRDSVASGAYWGGLSSYEGCTLTVFAHLARQSRRIVDIGANTGLFSLVAASVNADAQILSFEPYPKAVERMQENLRINGFSNVEIVGAAAAAQAGSFPLYYHEARRFFSTGASLIPRDYATGKVEVPVVRLDDFLRDRAPPGLDLIKLDVEGAEPAALAGSEEVISSFRPEIVSELVFKDCFPPMREFVKRHGYMAYRLAAAGLYPDPELSDEGPVAWNRLLVHPSRMDRIAGLPLHHA